MEEDSFLTSGTSRARTEGRLQGLPAERGAETPSSLIPALPSLRPAPGTAARALADTPEAGTWSGGVVQSAGLPCKPCCQRAHGVAELSRAARSHMV